MTLFPAIPTYVVNLKKRPDRRAHVLSEFSLRNEFAVTVVEAQEHPVGAIGLWHTIVQILSGLPEEEPAYILIVEDDHQFTPEYSASQLFRAITMAQEMGADVLIGGPSWFENAAKLSDGLYWLERFTGLQFTIIFRKFFQTMRNATFREGDEADKKIATLSSAQLMIHPFVSRQKDFGYSDVTRKNETPGRIDELYTHVQEKMRLINRVIGYYADTPADTGEWTEDDYDRLVIPAYVINLPERTERLAHIQQEFAGKEEFALTIVPACKHEHGAVGLWESIRKVVKMALENDDDVILVCEDDHQFTAAYSRKTLMRNIIEAHQQGADLLAGGIGYFGQIVPVGGERFWMDAFWSTQFIVLYRKCFDLILAEPFDDTVAADAFLSELTSHKMVLYPFVSVQKDFGYSDVCGRTTEWQTPDIFEKCGRRISENIRARQQLTVSAGRKPLQHPIHT